MTGSSLGAVAGSTSPARTASESTYACTAAPDTSMTAATTEDAALAFVEPRRGGRAADRAAQAVAALEDAHCVVYDPCILAFGGPQAGLTAVPGQPQNAIFSRA